MESKKTKSPRDYISPSDLTFLWGECKKCFWLKYREGISRPGFMPLVGPMSAFQEQLYRNAPASAVSKSMPAGSVSHWGEKVKSVPIVIDGNETKWHIAGKYDVIVSFDNGTVALIDCKVTTSEMDQSKIELYWPQLEAYAFALENPADGDPLTVSETGLLMWRVVNAKTNHVDEFTFGTDKEYISGGRSPEKFQSFIAKVIDLLDGPMPETTAGCPHCGYLAKRASNSA